MRQGDRFEQDLYEAVRDSVDPSYINACVHELEDYIQYASSKRQRLSEDRMQLKMTISTLDDISEEVSRYREKEAKITKKRAKRIYLPNTSNKEKESVRKTRRKSEQTEIEKEMEKYSIHYT